MSEFDAYIAQLAKDWGITEPEDIADLILITKSEDERHAAYSCREEGE